MEISFKMISKKNKLAIYHHLGMGDCIECHGIVRYYKEIYDKVYVFCKSKYLKSVKFMYRDDPSIIVVEVTNHGEQSDVPAWLHQFDGDFLKIGFGDYSSKMSYWEKKNYSCGQAFYELANVPYEYRNEKFFIKRDFEREKAAKKVLNIGEEKYIFVHDDPTRGYNIDVSTEYKVIKNNPTVDFFDMIAVLEDAEEIHCMSSSILVLIDCLCTKVSFKKLFLHYNVRNVNVGPESLIANWEFIYE